MAVTDHDSVGGIDEALAAGAELGIEVVPGVEINLEHGGRTVDLLGYFPGGPPGAELRGALAELRGYRDVRNAQILERLRALGLPDRARRACRRSPAAAPSGGLTSARPCGGAATSRSITEAFERFLRRGAPAWVDRRRLSLSAAVRLVRRADGLAVIAHPGIIRTDEAGLAAPGGRGARAAA